MRVIYKEAEQAHAVPARAYEARGPFDRYQPPEILDIPFDPDHTFPPGATVDNGMRGVVMYECQDCLAILRDDELDSHVCEGDH